MVQKQQRRQYNEPGEINVNFDIAVCNACLKKMENMMQYIILLRGVNVGGRNMKMVELKSCLEEAGFRQVVTVLQTGNVILESRVKSAMKLKQQVEALLTKTFHYPAKVLALTAEQLQAVIANYPFGKYGAEYHRYAVFTEEGKAEELASEVMDLDDTVEAIQAGKDVIYWRVLKGHTLDSDFGKYMAKAAAKNVMTNRNLNTLEKVAAKCS